MITLGATVLPNDIEWEDEFNWNPVGAVFAYALDGTPIMQVSSVSGGRPVTLTGQEDHSWMSRAEIANLRSMASTPGTVYLLTLLDGRTMNVVFRADGVEPVEASQVLYRSIDGVSSSFQYIPIIRLRQV